MKKLFLLILLLILSSQLKVYAGDCRVYDTGPKMIKRNPKAEVRVGEIYSFGYLLDLGQKLTSLPDGDYVYLMDNQHHTLWSPRVPNLNFPDDAILVTHRSLANKFFEIFGTQPEVIAAGEINTFNGVISRHWNKASTYPGELENLNYAENELAAFGIEFLDNTERVDLATVKVPDDHANEIAEALAMKSLLSNAEIAQSIRQFFSNYKKFSALYPSTYAGIMNNEAFLYTKGKNNYKAVSDRGWEQPYYLFNLLPRIASHDSVFAVMKNAIDEHGKYGFIEALNMVDQMEGSSSKD